MPCFSPRILSSTRTADNAYIDHGKAKSVNSPNIPFCGFRRKDNDSGININTEKVNFSAHNYQAVDFAQLGFSCRRVIPFCGSRGKDYGVDISRDNAGNVNLNTCNYGAGVVCAWGFCCCLSITITLAGALCFDIDNHFGIDINGFRNLSIDTDDHSSTRASRFIAIAIAIAAIVTTIIVAIFTAVTAIVIAVILVLTAVVAVTTTISSISITIASITIVSITVLVILMILIIPMSSHHLRHLKASGSEHAAEQRAGKFVSIDVLGHQLSWGAARDGCHGSSEPDRREEGDGGQEGELTVMVSFWYRLKVIDSELQTYLHRCDCSASLSGRGRWFFESPKGRLECAYETGAFVWLIRKDRISERATGRIYLLLRLFSWPLPSVVMPSSDEDEEHRCEGMSSCLGDQLDGVELFLPLIISGVSQEVS
ncbi:Putative protein of unknown function [Podospora comata]|uniref:Uncharacterized protein n=1 Tax=Podospora comata TaxID=48703 RepID=A0ABY6S3K3_PODCO|nr:Putative protein of unknown function [Podospora comata]